MFWRLHRGSQGPGIKHALETPGGVSELNGKSVSGGPEVRVFLFVAMLETSRKQVRPLKWRGGARTGNQQFWDQPRCAKSVFAN